MKYSLAVFKRALKLYKDKAKDDFYKDIKHLVECQEKELREKLHAIKLNHEQMARIKAQTMHKFYEGKIVSESQGRGRNHTWKCSGE